MTDGEVHKNFLWSREKNYNKTFISHYINRCNRFRWLKQSDRFNNMTQTIIKMNSSINQTNFTLITIKSLS